MNIFVIGATSVFAVFRFTGVAMCIIIAMGVKTSRFMSATQIRGDGDVITWHEQFSQLQRSINLISSTMLQSPIACLLALDLTITLSMVAYAFVGKNIFAQPVFYEMLISTLVLNACCLIVLFLAAQVSVSCCH